MKREDLTNRRFGKLVAKEYVGNGKWRCLCDCGKQTEVYTENLKRSHTTSCGCVKGTGIIGKTVGNLTVKSQIDENYYLCVCGCGGETIRAYKSLTQSGNQQCDKCAAEKRTRKIQDTDFIDGTQKSKIALKKAPTKANRSGVVGVNWDKSRGKWQASIKFKGHKYNLGRFANIQDAIDARCKAEKEIFGDFLKWYETQYKK